MSSLSKVALVGKGVLGSAILHQLVQAGHDVIVLSRNASVKDLPTGVKAVQVDYSSVESIASALKGRDAVVVSITTEMVPIQKTIIDGSIFAGVKRFIPSDFGSLNMDPKASWIPLYQPFIQIQDYLKQKAESGEIEYTFFAVGPFLEYVFGSPLFVDCGQKTVQIFGNGDQRISTTSIAGIGKAIVGALSEPEKTKNRLLHVHEAVVTQRGILELAKKASPGSEWHETFIDPKVEFQSALKSFEETPADFSLVFRLLKAGMLSGDYASEYTDVDNDLVGLPLLSAPALENIALSTFRQG